MTLWSPAFYLFLQHISEGCFSVILSQVNVELPTSLDIIFLVLYNTSLQEYVIEL